MNTTLEEVCDALDKLGAFVSARTNETRLLVEVQGWHNSHCRKYIQ